MRLQPLRTTWIETLFPVANPGYAFLTDGFHATFLPGRNVVVVEAASLDGLQGFRKVCQPAEFCTAMEKFPGKNEPGLAGMFGRGITGFDAAGQIPGVVVEAFDYR